MRALCHIFLALLLTARLAMGSGGYGVSVLLSPPATIGPIATNPNVDMVSIGFAWCETETGPGTFDWTFFDSQIAAAVAAHKMILLRPKTGGGFPTALMDETNGFNPRWLAGSSYLNVDPDSLSGVSGKTIMMATTAAPVVVWWNSVYAARREAFYTAIGAHLATLSAASQAAVKLVSVAVCNGNTEDWNMLDTTSTGQSLWASNGYTTAVFLTWAANMIAAAMTAFPNQNVTFPLGKGMDINDAAAASADGYSNALFYGAWKVCHNAYAVWGDRLWAARNAFSLTIPTVPPSNSNNTFTLLYSLKLEGHKIWGQNVWNYYTDPGYRCNDGTDQYPNGSGLHRTDEELAKYGVDDAYPYQVEGLEIYKQDAVNMPSSTTYAHVMFRGPTETPAGINLRAL